MSLAYLSSGSIWIGESLLIRPQEPGDITRIQRRGCHLVQQRLERVIGVTIDQRYVHVHASQPVYSGRASKPATDNKRHATPIDRAIQDTRGVVYPLHGLDPRPPRLADVGIVPVK